MIENVCPIVSIIQAIYKPSLIERSIFYGVVSVTLHTSEDAVKVAEELDGQLFHDVHLRVSNKLHTIIQHYHSLPDTEGKQYMREFL